MIEYLSFVEVLTRELAALRLGGADSSYAVACVDGLASSELRRLASLETRREYGAFFTSKELAANVLSELSPTFCGKAFIYDAACGAGNLLISASDYIRQNALLPEEKVYLAGTDIHESFATACKLRLEMNEILHYKHIAQKPKRKKKFTAKVADGLKNNSFYKKATHIFLNPPFNQKKQQENPDWATGAVSMAALFLDKAVEYCRPGTEIIAILPDVLRSGTRYEKWRKKMTAKCDVKKTVLLGQFDKFADVDVYAIRLVKKSQEKYLTSEIASSVSIKNKVLKDLFDVCVGPVVDNRDPHEGPLRPYLVSKGLRPGKTVKAIDLSRCFAKKSFKSPFVAVKRISRMTDVHRASATIIALGQPAYADNHIIVLSPKSGTLKDCKIALKILKDPRTAIWINERIRCRHLPVGMIAELPLWS